MSTAARDSAAAAPIVLSDAYDAYRTELVDAGLLIPSGTAGVYGRSGLFESVLLAFDRYVTRIGGGDGADVMRFPPVLPRDHFERSGYLDSFPHLVGTVRSFEGNEHDHHGLLRTLQGGGDWSSGFASAGLVLTPAACYPVYPTLTGMLPPEGRLIDVLTQCFRHEPSADPARMQSFRQREYVRVGSPEMVRAHRDLWLDRAQEMMRAVQLPAGAEIANDPFFGRTGRMLAASQRDQALKFEIVVPICSTEKPTACVSCNYHQDHFGLAFDIRTADGAPAHTACVGFGLERITLALFRHHGFDPRSWPDGVRATLEL